jgi:hypothetical protein
MISIKEAAQKAVEFCQDLYADAQELLLEEVEFDEMTNFWLITISFWIQKHVEDAPSVFTSPFASRFERRYKTLTVNANTGLVMSMKIRELQS